MSEATKAFISLCWFPNGNIAACTLFYEETYILNGKKYKFTREILDEIITSEQVRVREGTSKFVNLIGI